MLKVRRQPISLRALEAADYAALPGLTASAEEAGLVYWEADDPTGNHVMHDFLQTRQDLTVAEFRKRVVGLGALYDVEEGKKGYVGPLVVDPAYRGHGVGHRLMFHLLDLAFRRYRLREVRVRLLADNEDGILLCSGLGFLPYSNEERPGPDGRNRVVVQMRLDRRGYEDSD